MVIAREHRRSLEESMKTAVVFETKEDMIKYYKDLWSTWLHKDVNITISNDTYYDNRTGWTTQYILCDKGIVGMCDLNYQEESKYDSNKFYDEAFLAMAAKKIEEAFLKKKPNNLNSVSLTDREMAILLDLVDKKLFELDIRLQVPYNRVDTDYYDILKDLQKLLK